MRQSLFLVLFFISGICFAQPLIAIHSKDAPRLIGKSVELFEDKTASLGINQVIQEARKGNFKLSEFDIPNYNVTRSVIWAHFKVSIQDSALHYLLVDPPSMRNVWLYSRTSGGEFSESKMGMYYPENERAIYVNHFLFPLKGTATDTIECFLRVANYEGLQLYMKIVKPEQFILATRSEDAVNIFAFGLMWMMVIYNLYLYITSKERAYLYYVLYVFFNFCFMCMVTDFVFYLPKLFSDFMDKGGACVPAIMAVFGTLFTFRFLNVKENAPRYYKLLLANGGVLLIAMALSLIGFRQESILLMELEGFVFGILVILTGIAVWRKGYQPAKYHLIGYGLYMIGLCVFIAMNFHVFATNYFTMNSLQIGTSLEVILLSFALGDKMNTLKEEKEVADQLALQRVRENEKLVREQNVVLEVKVQERTAELAEKNKEILDSIHYAKRIQSTLLASEGLLSKNLKDHFILFKPKDIVSGDFYWATEKDGRFYLAVCDSTGHGVPGAFMSLLNTSFLNEAITEKGIVKPNEIFNHVRQRLIENVSSEGGRDGMDGTLVCFDKSRNEISYAAANNPPMLMSGTLEELPSDNMPVGAGERNESFENHVITFSAGNILYLYTDGYADQFGGPKGKKFKYRQLNDKLLSISNRPLSEQKKNLEETFNDWKGNLEQVDDVLIIGVKL